MPASDLPSGHLLFTGKTTRLSIVPDPDTPAQTKAPALHRYQIQNGASRVVTVFLTVAQATSYPARTDDLEFLLLTRCSIYIHTLAADLLGGFGDWESTRPYGSDDLVTRDPAIFDPKFYERARVRMPMSFRGFSRRRDRHDGMPEPPQIYLSHVMLSDMVGDVIERKAMGLVVQSGVDWDGSEQFCLG